jgi:hypothetical protein
MAAVDGTKTYAFILSDVPYLIMIICGIVWKLQYKIIDEENCPQGLEHSPDEWLLLQKTIYGLVQSITQFFKKPMERLQSIGLGPTLQIQFS